MHDMTGKKANHQRKPRKSADEQIALTHRAFDRRAFAVGAVRAALWTAGRAPGLYSMLDVLGMRAGPASA